MEGIEGFSSVEWIRPSKAFGRRSACADRESVLCVGAGRRLARSALRGRFQSAPRPSAGGSACTPNEFGLQGPLAGESAYADREKILLRRRRPTLGAPAP